MVCIRTCAKRDVTHLKGLGLTQISVSPDMVNNENLKLRKFNYEITAADLGLRIILT